MYNHVHRYIMIYQQLWLKPGYVLTITDGNEARCGKCNIIRISSLLMKTKKYIVTLIIEDEVHI
jgi:hypothetical protein